LYGAARRVHGWPGGLACRSRETARQKPTYVTRMSPLFWKRMITEQPQP
jgi:hypothetical protein